MLTHFESYEEWGRSPGRNLTSFLVSTGDKVYDKESSLDILLNYLLLQPQRQHFQVRCLREKVCFFFSFNWTPTTLVRFQIAILQIPKQLYLHTN